MQKEKATQTISSDLDMWSFYEPGDWPIAKMNTDFIRFLLSPGTQSIETVSFDHDHMTFAPYGPPGKTGFREWFEKRSKERARRQANGDS